MYVLLYEYEHSSFIYLFIHQFYLNVRIKYLVRKCIENIIIKLICKKKYIYVAI